MRELKLENDQTFKILKNRREGTKGADMLVIVTRRKKCNFT